MDPRTQPIANSAGKRRHDDSLDDNDGEGEVCALAKRPKTPFTRHSSIQSWYPESSSSTRLTASSYTVAWICAIHYELAAAMAMLDETHPHLRDQPEHDSNHYTLGSISGHNVAVACLPAMQYGTVNATNVLTNLKRTFPCIRTCLMVGVGGGVPSLSHDIRLGDVVVGVRVMPYELGKVVAGGQIQYTNSCLTLDHSISTLLSTIRAKHELAPSRVPSIIQERFSSKPEYRHPELSDRLFQATYNHMLSNTQDQCDACDESMVVRRRVRPSSDPEIHYGAIASGDKLIKDGPTRDELARTLDVICFEMEAAGLMGVMPCLPIRGICDYSDSHKNKDWQQYSAAAAAAYARELLEAMPAASVKAPTMIDIQSSGETESDQSSLHERRAQILSSLAFPQLHVRKQTIKRAQAKTCQWFLKTPEYGHWQDLAHHNDHHGFLWIRGKPGVGKSTMMKFLFDNARKSEKKMSSFNICFFFNARGDTLEKSVSGMYRSLLLQLLEHFTDLQDLLDDASLISRYPDECLPLDTLKDAFETAISRLGNRTLTCFVDALDEGDEQQIIEMVHFFEGIAEASSQSGIPFKICFSSRHYPYINIKCGQSLSLEDQEGHKDDLRHYIQAKLGVKDVEMLSDLEMQLVDKSQGVFLWLTLVVDILRQEINRGGLAVKKRLAEIPPGLSDLFRDIIARDTKNMNDLLLGISWILFAKRPLTLLEYYHAIWAGLARSGDVDDEMPKVATNGVEDLAERCVLSSSKGLAEVTQAKKLATITKADKRTVQFIHESVRDFLLKDGGMNELWPDLSLNMEAKSHEKLKECCLFYLRHRAVTGLISDPDHDVKEIDFDMALSLNSSIPFLEYASQHVLFHADAAGAILPQDETLRLFSTADWAKLFNMYERYKVRRYDHSTRLIYMLADQGLANLIRSRIRTESPNVHEKSARHRFPLFAALAKGHESAAAAVLDITSLSIFSREYTKWLELRDHTVSVAWKRDFPLTWAARHGLLDVIHALIKQGVDVNEHDPTLRNPLDTTLASGYLEAARVLLEHGARSKSGLYLEQGAVRAAMLGDESLVRSLIDLGAAAEHALLAAFSSGNEAMVGIIIAHGTNFGCLAHVKEDLIQGCRENSTAIVKYLTQDKNDPEVRSRNSKRLLFCAARLGLDSESGFYVPDGVDVNCRNASNETPLLLALQCKSWPTAELLLDKGADVNVFGGVHESALHIALKGGADENLIKLLLAGGANAAMVNYLHQTPLHYASSLRNNGAVVSLLLKFGSTVDPRDSRNDTPLLIASRLSCVRVVAVLLQHGANSNAINDDTKTPLAEACERGDHLIVSELLRHGSGASIDCHSRGLTPLHIASGNGKVKIVRLLIRAGAAIKNTWIGTPLHVAVTRGHTAVVKAILEEGQYDIDAMNPHGWTSLCVACDRDDREMAELLLKFGASSNVRDKLGDTPLDRAVKADRQPIVSLLTKYRAGVIGDTPLEFSTREEPESANAWQDTSL